MNFSKHNKLLTLIDSNKLTTLNFDLLLQAVVLFLRWTLLENMCDLFGAAQSMVVSCTREGINSCAYWIKKNFSFHLQVEGCCRKIAPWCLCTSFSGQPLQKLQRFAVCCGALPHSIPFWGRSSETFEPECQILKVLRFSCDVYGSSWSKLERWVGCYIARILKLPQNKD